MTLLNPFIFREYDIRGKVVEDFPKHVVEVESNDIINSTTNGIIKKHILKFDKTYMVEDYCPSVSLTTPVFTRFRSDKKINISDK